MSTALIAVLAAFFGLMALIHVGGMIAKRRGGRWTPVDFTRFQIAFRYTPRPAGMDEREEHYPYGMIVQIVPTA